MCNVKKLQHVAQVLSRYREALVVHLKDVSNVFASQLLRVSG